MAIQRRVSAASPPEAAVLLRQAYELRDYFDDRSALRGWLQAVAGDRSQHGLVRDQATELLARIEVHEGRLDAARDKYAGLGFVREWKIFGPLPARAFDAPIAAENNASTEATAAPRWRTVPVPGPQPWIDLADFFSHADPAVVVAQTALYSESDRIIAVRFGCDSAVALSVNGARVFADGEGSGLAFDQHVVAVELRPGWNRLRLEFRRQGERQWRFGLRVTELRGGGVSLRSSPDADGPTVAATNAKPDDLLAMAQSAQPQSPEALETLAWLELERSQSGAARDHLEQAARIAPSAKRWYAVSELQEGSQKFSALTAAIAADSGFAPAQIALAEYYLERKQLEKARDLLQRILAADPANFVARKRLADVYAAAGANSRALTEYLDLARAFPRPLWVQREIADKLEDFGLLEQAAALVELARRDNFDGADELALAKRMAQHRRDTGGLRALYEQARQLNPTDTENLAQLAALEAGAGNFDRAEQILRSALALDPESDNLHQRLGDVLASRGNPAGARRELARALELNPRLDEVRRRLEFSSEAPTVARDPDTEYLVDPAALAAAARRIPPEEAAPAVVLAEVRVERVQPNGLSSVHVQQVTYIADDEAGRNRSLRSVQYSPESQQLRILRARVYKPDGRVLEAEIGGEDPVADGGMYYDVRARALRFRDVARGDVVEVEYRVSPLATLNPYGNYFGELVAFRAPVPQRLQRYVLVTPADRRFYVHEVRMPSPASVAITAGTRTYRWEATDTPALDSEPRGPSLTQLAPYVHVSTFGSWQDLGTWYAQLIRPQFELDAALRDVLANLLSNAHTDQEKIRAVHDFVLRNTHYVALEFGVYSYKPYPVSQVYARRFGDCKDKASLMIALLRAAGIEADLALVRTRRLGDLDDQPASISIFNHAVVYLPGYDLWLDGTAEYSGLRELPIEDQGAMALVVSREGHAEMRRIPLSAAADNFTRRTVHAQIEPDGTIHFTGSAYTRGEDAPGLRREYEIAERRRDSFRNRLAEVFPSVRVENVEVRGANTLDRDITVEFRGELATFTGLHALALNSSWMPRSYVEMLAPLASRGEDLLLPAPWSTEEELHFVLPEGASVPRLPADSALHTPFGSASLRYSVDKANRELVIQTHVEIRQTRIPPQQYAAFRDFCSSLERSFRGEVKVVLPR